MRVSASKFLLIGRSGSKSQFSTYKSYENHLTEIFVMKTDYPHLMNAITLFTQGLISNKGVPDSIKIKFLNGLAESATNDLFSKQFIGMDQLKKTSSMLVSFAESVSSFSETLSILDGLSKDESQHAMTTCMIALSICDEMDIKVRSVLEKVAMGSLLHDIGLKYVPQSIIVKPRHEWTIDEISIYENHPIKGVETLRDMKDITNDILLIIAEHHENSIGTGYPKRIRDVKISPLGKIVIAADFFADLLFSRLNSNLNLTADRALEYIEDILGQPFNKQVYRALKTIVNKHLVIEKSRLATKELRKTSAA
jgi:putative nucleotidyltransferase with HDIG domain